MARWGRFAAVSLLGAALLTACAATTTTTRPSTGASSGRERRPRPLATWQRRYLQAGAAEERGARAAQGFLPVTIYRPGGRQARFPSSCCSTGAGACITRPCGRRGSRRGPSCSEPMGSARRWSTASRRVASTRCAPGTSPPGPCVGRTTRTASARWLAEQPYVDATRIARHGHVERRAHRAGGVARDAEAPAPVHGRRRALSRLPDRCRQHVLCAIARTHRQRRHRDPGALLRGR